MELVKSILINQQNFLSELAIVALSCTFSRGLMAGRSGDLLWLRYQWAVQMFQTLLRTGETIVPCHFFCMPTSTFSVLASNEEAWQETRDLHGMMSMAYPYDELVWGSASTQDSTSWIPFNDFGTCMSITVIVGFKYVVLAVPKGKQTQGNPLGDLRSIRAFGKPDMESWSPTDSCHELWNHEGVLLGPGDTL